MQRLWLIFSLAVLALSVWTLESARWDIDVTRSTVGQTPIMTFETGAANSPQVVMAHGFAGSSQMMQGYALTLAQAGYRVTVFDFEGHGRNPVPMSGDVTSIDGTTQRLVDQTRAVMESVNGDGPIALIGHSMATDVLVRVAQAAPNTGPLVLISAFSQEIDQAQPPDLLLIPGTWEVGLRAFALSAVQQINPGAQEYQTVIQGDIRRRSSPAPYAEHVAVLHSRTGRAEALEWLNTYYGRDQTAPTPPTGQALLGLLFALVALMRPLARILPVIQTPSEPLPMRQFALVLTAAMLIAPLMAVALHIRVLPVLVADYLALHLLIYGVVMLAVLHWCGRLRGGLSVKGIALLLIWGLAVFGLALDRYGANFWPTPQRLGIIAVMALGTVPFMLADATLALGAPLWQRITARIGLLVSLGIAVALDPSDLFFLLMIGPVIVLFFLVYGIMGRRVAPRSGPMTVGLALGLILAWALGVSFPMFAPG